LATPLKLLVAKRQLASLLKRFPGLPMSEIAPINYVCLPFSSINLDLLLPANY
jgi:hypothetical protein